MGYVHQSTAAQALRMLFPEDADLKRAVDFTKKLTYFPFIGLMEPEPHLKELLLRLRPRYKTAISTNRSDTMGHVLEAHGLSGLFDCVVTSLDVPRPKPHPDPLLKALELLCLEPEEAIYIGDSPVDQEAAAACGVPFAGYANPSLSARWHLDSLAQVDDILNGKGHRTGL